MTVTAPLPLPAPRPTADQPLLGQSVLVVEDSRFASDALRLICQRLGARVRRADSLAAARRHLAGYRPTLVVVDIGLPDGDGSDLIRALGGRPGAPAILAISGDPGAESAARAAGARGFVTKPVASIAAFRAEVATLLPDAARPLGPAALPMATVIPDAETLRQDYQTAARLIAGPGRARAYALGFLSSVAVSAGDPILASAARDGGQQDRLAGLIADRLARLPAPLGAGQAT